jgi:hypothetical protein
LEPAVERLAAGIERRSPFVYGQPFVRAVRPVRWLIPSAIYRTGQRAAAQAERTMNGDGVDLSQPVGAGGRADVEARSRRA